MSGGTDNPTSSWQAVKGRPRAVSNETTTTTTNNNNDNNNNNHNNNNSNNSTTTNNNNNNSMIVAGQTGAGNSQQRGRLQKQACLQPVPDRSRSSRVLCIIVCINSDWILYYICDMIAFS